MHNDDAIDHSTGETKKPEIISFYNLTEGAVDVVDEMGAAYSTARIAHRWPMAVFFSVLNVAAINARIILLSAKEPPTEFTTRRSFIKYLGMKLIEQHKFERSQKPMLPLKLKQTFRKRKNSSDYNEPESKKSKVTYKRCADCPSKRDRKTKYCCLKCKKSICMEHMSPICKSCEKICE